LFKLQVGENSKVFVKSDRFVVTKLAERREEGRVPFADVQKEIEAALLEEQRNLRTLRALEEIRAAASITTIFDDEDA